MEKIGKQNGEAHLQVLPCTCVRKAPAPKKKRLLETPAAAASGTTGDVAESEAEPAFIWLPTGFATVKIFQRPGQADHGARDACATGL